VSKDFVRNVLKEYAEADMPKGNDPWPAIRERLQPGILQPATASSPIPAVSDLLQPQIPASPRVGRTAIVRGIGIKPSAAGAQHRGLKLSLPMALVMILGAVTLGLAVFESIKIATPGATQGSEFVPAGKARHIVINTKREEEGPDKIGVGVPTTGTIEVWYANGRNNLLQHTRFLDYGAGNSRSTTSEVWVQDNTMYTTVPDDKVVLWQPWTVAPVYAPNGLYGPDPNLISKVLQQPNARIISDTVMDGRDVIVIGFASPDEDSQWWIDKDAHRPFQWREASIQGGHTVISTEKMVLDELVGINTLPPDFFEFKLPEGFRLVQRKIPTPLSTPVPTVTP
jgi:hypothetical protein